MSHESSAGGHTRPVTPMPPRSGWAIVIAFAALHLLLAAKISTLGPRRVPQAGDPMALWVGLGFLLWGLAFAVSPRAYDTSMLFRFLNRRSNATLLGVVFLGMATWLLATWVGVL